MMSEFTTQLEHLQQELSRKENDLQFTVEYANRLAEENEDLKAQIETLRQEKHSLQLNCDVNSQMIHSQNSEIDAQKENCDYLTKSNNKLTKENSQLTKKLKECTSENVELQKELEDSMSKNESYVKKILELERKVQSYQKQEPKTLNETKNEDLLKLIQELDACQSEKREALSLISDFESRLCHAKMNEDKLQMALKELREHLVEKNEELQSYSTLIEKSKEENAELQAAIEILKLEQVDENKRGNSVFGEVDDRRRAVEKEYLVLREKYKALKESYERRGQEMQKMREEFSMALGLLGSGEADSSYIKELEIKLFEARKEIEQLNNMLDKKKSHLEIVPKKVITESGDHDDYGYLKTLLIQSRKKIDNLQADLEKQRFSNVAQANKLLETEQSLHSANKSIESLRKEVFRLSLRNEELIHLNAMDHKENFGKLPGSKEKVEKQDVKTYITVMKGDTAKDIIEKSDEDHIQKPKVGNQESRKEEVVKNKLQTHSLHSERKSSTDCPRQFQVKKEISRYATAPAIKMDMGHSECTQQ